MERFVLVTVACPVIAMMVALSSGCGQTADAEAGRSEAVTAQSTDAEGLLLSDLSSGYLLNLRVDRGEVEKYLDEFINPVLTSDGQDALSPVGPPDGPVVGAMVLQERVIRGYNSEEYNGEQIGGRSVNAGLYLFVQDGNVPPPITLLVLDSWETNEEFIAYLREKGLGVAVEPSQIARKQVEDDEAVEAVWGASGPPGELEFNAEFVAPDPAVSPPRLTPGVCVAPAFALRFASAPERVFLVSQDRAFVEPKLDSVDLVLELELDDQGAAAAIFDGLDESAVTRFRYVTQHRFFDEIDLTPPTPENKDDCKNGGWMNLRRADGSPFKNQGDCIQFVNTGK